MNAKGTIPPNASGGTALLLGFAIVWAVKQLFFDEDAENKPENTPTSPGTENTGKTAVIPVNSVPISPIFVPKTPRQFPPTHKRNRITRNHMEIVFQRGTRTFYRTEAVEALKGLGFGQSAAYEAVSPNGRFSAWLQFAPDGVIFWKG
jgi:hypothetical protein